MVECSFTNEVVVGLSSVAVTSTQFSSQNKKFADTRKELVKNRN